MRTLTCGCVVGLALATLGGCGGGAGGVDKSPDELNFSRATAADAEVYVPGATESTQTSTSETTESTTTESTTTESTPTSTTGGAYTDYTAVRDSSGAISFEVPKEWAAVAPDAVGPFQAAVSVAFDQDGFTRGWTSPGAFVAVSTTLGKQIVDAPEKNTAFGKVWAAVSPRGGVLEDHCDEETIYLALAKLFGTAAAENMKTIVGGGGVSFNPLTNVYTNCGGYGTEFVDMAGYSEPAQAFVYVQLQLTSVADLAAAQRVVETLKVDFEKLPAPTAEQTGPDFTIP